MKTGFIGAGKVGCSLGRYLTSKGVEVTGYYDRDTKAAAEAAEFIRGEDQGKQQAVMEAAVSGYTGNSGAAENAGAAVTGGAKAYESDQALVADSDLIFITVPDGLIAEVFREISAYDIKDKFVCHCSGSISSRDAFEGAAAAGAYTYSVHPLFAVSDRFTAWKELAGAFFTLEGDPARIDDMAAFLTKAGLRFQIIDPASKTKYHLAAVYASNLICGLLGEAGRLLHECGFAEDEALKALAPLVRGNVDHVLEHGAVQALTGPVERGDIATLRKHLAVCESEEDRRLYRELSGKLVGLAKEKHPDRDYTELEQFLKQE